MQTRSLSSRFILSSRDFEPAYLALHRTGELRRRAEAAVARLADCHVCPRDCGVDRLADKTAACKTGRYARVSSYFPHLGEEDCLRGWNGSGTIFFSLCNLRCVFCFHPDTPIPTDRGLMRIADLFEQGDGEIERDGGSIRFIGGKVQVATSNGTFAPVSKAFRHSYRGDLIRLKPFNCPPLLLTPNHQIFAAHKADPERVIKIPAGDLTKEHYLIVPKRVPAGTILELDIREHIASDERRFRKSSSPQFTAPVLASIFAEGGTSDELAQRTGYHPVYIRKLRGVWKRGALTEDSRNWAVNEVIEEGGLIRFKTEKRPGIPVKVPLDERLGWLLGIYCAEGHVTAAKNRPNSCRLVFSFGKDEIDLALKVDRLLHELFGIEPQLMWRRTTITVEVGKASLALFFSLLCGKGAHAKQVPAILRHANHDAIQAFLDGLIDGDGWEDTTRQVINTVSEQLALGLFEVGLLLGILPSYHRWEPAPTKIIEGRTVQQSTLYYVKFPKLNPVTGKRHSKWAETPSHFRVPIHRIERVPYEGPVYNLEVDDSDHSYLAPFVAVSNCQNFDISQAGEGAIARPERIAAMMLDLQAAGCHNLNFVTPEHVVPQLLEALVMAVERGLRLPIVYNTSAYDSQDSLNLLDGIVDIYMPDFKFWDPKLSLLYLKAKDYAPAAMAAIREMHRQVGDLTFDEHGLAKRGVLVRHLVMPGGIAGTAEIMRFLAGLSPDMYVNVMDQYYPAGKVSIEKYAEINRRTTSQEFQEAVRIACDAGLWRLDERVPRRPWIMWEAN